LQFIRELAAPFVQIDMMRSVFALSQRFGVPVMSFAPSTKPAKVAVT